LPKQLNRQYKNFLLLKNSKDLLLPLDFQKFFKVLKIWQKKMGDEFVSREHLLLALMSANCQSSQILKENGVQVGKIKEILKEVRGSQKADTPDPEGKIPFFRKILSKFN